MFNFSRILDIIKAVANTKTFQTAGEIAFKKLGERIDEKAHDPEAVKAIAKELKEEAPQIVGAIAKGTEAEPLVDPATIHKG